ncbi:MAG: CoA transferase [Acidobacteria bacterium]|nr:CoA transferase [Acidobacteriota bacterium]
MSRPLGGIRILAVSQFGAGPYGTLLLADLGAEIIKIEDPASGGDVSRSVPPPGMQEDIEADSIYFQCLNRNKRSLRLNLAEPEGQAIFHRLLRISHAVFNNLRGDVPARLGLTYETLRVHNPAIVCCSLSAFGRHGPQASLPGYDPLLQASEGYMSLTGGPGEPPTKCGVSVIDFAAGSTAALGLMAGIWSAQKTGVGCDVDVSLRDTAISMLNYYAVWYLNRGVVPERLANSSHALLVPAQTFRTSDGYLAIFCGKEKFWRELCAILSRPELAGDSRFRDFEQRDKNKTALLAILEPLLASRTTAEWVALMTGKVPCAPVRSLAQALDDPVLRSENMIVEVEHSALGVIREAGCPIKISGDEPELHPAPALGQDTDEILSAYLGYAPQQIQSLRARGIV